MSDEVEKIHFANKYFSKISKIVRVKSPAVGVGEFIDKVVIHYEVWYRRKETLIYRSSDEADKAFIHLQDIMEHQIDKPFDANTFPNV